MNTELDYGGEVVAGRNYRFEAVEENPPVPPIEGVREYLNWNSDLLFVADELPPKHVRKFIFGRSTRKVFETMQAAGLIDFPVDDLIKAEIEMFGVGFQPGFNIASIAQLTTRSFVKGGTCFVFHNWERITSMIPLINAQKLVLVGGQVRKSLEQRSLRRYDNPFGHLGVYVDGSVSVPLYGVPLSGGDVDDWCVLDMKRKRDSHE